MKGIMNFVRMLFALVVLSAPALAFAGTGQLVISKSGSGTGTVASDPEGINCGSTCATAFNSGVSVTLTATPEGGSAFSGWLGEGCSGRGTCTVTFEFDNNNDYAVTATFSKLGDVDGNGKVEIKDAIVALQVASGRTPASQTDPHGDVDGDQKIDLPEAIFGIQYIAGLRNNDQRAKAGSITIVKDAQPNDAQGFTFTGNQNAIMPFLLDDDGDNTNTLSNQKGFYLRPGSYTFTEPPVSDWNIASIVCKPSGGTSTDITTGTATISLATGDNVTCTFTNTKQTTETGTICGIKFNDLNGNGLQDPGELGIPNWQISLGLVTIPGVTTDAKGSYCFNNLPAGTYTVSETARAPWQQTFPPAPGTHTVTLAAGESIDGLNFGNKIPTDSCSNYLCNGDFENDQVVSVGSQGFFNQSLISCWNTTEADDLIEVWGSGFGGVPAYSGNQFIELNARMGATLYQNFTAIPGSTVTISFAHRGRAGFPNQMTVSIRPVSGTPSPLGTFTAITTAWTPHSVTYTFPNNGVTAYVLGFTADDSTAGGNFLDAVNVCQADPVGSLTIVKDALPNDAQDFAFYAFGPNSGSIMPFLLDDDAGAVGADNLLSNSKTFSNLAPGSYSVTEDFFNPVPVTGWDVTGIICTSSTGMPVGTVDLANRAFTVNLAAGDNVTCTFTNTKQQTTGTGSLTIVKDALSNDAQDFAFYSFGPNSGSIMPFLLDDDAGAVGADNLLSNTKTFANLAPGSYSVTEDFSNPVPVTGWDLTGIVCLPAGSATVDLANRAFTVNLAAGDNVTCTFTNVKASTPPDLSITKTGVVSGQNITYTITITNNGTTAPTNPIHLIDLLSPLPVGTIYNYASGVGSCTAPVPGQPWDCVIPPENLGQPITIGIVVPAGGGTVTNCGTVTLTGEANTLNNHACVTNIVPAAPTPPDLSITKTGVVNGQNITYTITITNLGTTPPTDTIHLLDTLSNFPAGTIYNFGSGVGPCTIPVPGQPWDCEVPAVNLGQPLTIGIVVPAGGGSVTNCAQATLAGEANTLNNQACVTNVVPAVATPTDLAITKTGVVSGQNVTYTITITNLGTTPPMDTIHLLDTLSNFPAGTIYDFGSGVGPCTIPVPGQAWDCEVPAGNLGQPLTVGIVVPAGGGSVTNCAQVSLAGETNLLNNQACVTNIVPAAPTPTDLAITKVGVVSGQNITYTITITNNGTTAPTNPIHLIDLLSPLPVGTIYNYASGVGSCTAPVAGQAWDCVIPPENLGLPITIGIIVPAGGGTVTNCGTVTLTGEANTLNNQACVTNIVPAAPTPPDLSITKTGVVNGQNITYTITITNNGTTPPTDTIHLVDLLSPLPAGTIYNYASGVGSCTAPVAGQDWDCVIPPENLGLPITIGIVVPAGGGSVTNCGTVTLTGEANTLNNQACVTNIVPAAPTPPDLSITKTSVVSGLNVTYTITITNNGTSAPTAPIHLIDLLSPLPAGTIYNYASGVGSCTAPVAGQDWDCIIPPENLGLPITIGIIVPAGGGTVTNCGTVTLTGETNTLNNQACVTNIVPAAPTAPDLSVTKVCAVNGPQSVLCTVTVTNNGSAASVSPISLTDILTGAPSDALYTGAGGTLPISCSPGAGPISPIACTANTSLAPGEFKYALFSFTLPQGGAFTNCATVVQGNVMTQPESNSANNTNICTTITVPPPGTTAAPDLSVTKVCAVNGPQSVLCTVTVTNNGSVPSVSPISLTDILTGAPADALYTGAGGTLPISCSPGAGPVTPIACTANTSLSPGESKYALFSFTLPQGGTFTNCATVVQGNVMTQPESNSANNTNICTTLTVPPPGTTAAPDLSVTKVCTVNGPQSVLCTVTVTNNGSAASVSPISLTDILTGAPADALYTGAGGTLPISCSPGAGPVTPIACTANTSLSPGESQYALFSFTLPQGGTFTNCATVVQGNVMTQPESNTANNTNICTTLTVPPPGTTAAPDLSVTKVCAVNGPQSVLCTVTVTNNGSAASVSPISLTDILTGAPADALYTGAGGTLPISCSPGAGPVTPIACTANTSLAPGESQYALFSFTLPQGGTFTNCATVVQGNVATQPESNTANNTNICTTLTVPPPGTTAAPDLSVTKVCAVNGPQSVLCTVTVTNNGSAASVSPITLTDILTGAPADALYTGAGGTLPISCSPGAGPVTPIACTANTSLAPGESQYALFSFTLPQGGTFTNCATVMQGNVMTQPEFNSANNTNICTTLTVPPPGTTAAPDLSVTKVCAVNGPQSVLCTVTVTNNGSAASVSPLSLTDILTGAPSDALYTGAGGTLPVSCSPGAGPVTPIACTANTSLAPGESQYALFSFTLPQGGTFTNCATVVQGTVAAQYESNSANNTNICTTITVPPPGTTAAPDLSVTKTSVVSYQGVTYTITVTNNGTVPTVNPVVVTDTVVAAPANSVFNFNGYGTACSVAGANTATCTSAAPLAANGGQVTFTFGFSVPANGSGSWSGTVTNCASVPADSNLSNNQACVTDTIGSTTGTITIVKDAVPDDPQDFEFIVNNYLYTYLDDDNDDVRSNQHLFSSLAAGSYTLTETQVTGWDLTGISCTPSSGTTVDLFNRTVTVDLADGANVTCTFTNTKQPDNLTFTAVNGPTLQVSTQAMIPTVLMTSTAFTSTTTGGVTTATVATGPAGVPNDGIRTLANPYPGDTLVGAIATLPSSVLLSSGPPALSIIATSCGGSSGGISCPPASLIPLFSADFGMWAITNALASPLPTNSVITYIAFAGGTQLTTAMPTGTATYTGKMTGVLANTPIGGSDDVSGNVILNFDFDAGTINGSLSGISGIVTTQGVSTITPCVYPLSAPACTYTAYAQPANVPFNDITLSNGTIAGNSFSATITTPAITGATTMTMNGNFYGVTANEVAGTFTISVPSPGPGMILIGSFGAKP